MRAGPGWPSHPCGRRDAENRACPGGPEPTLQAGKAERGGSPGEKRLGTRPRTKAAAGGWAHPDRAGMNWLCK